MKKIILTLFMLYSASVFSIENKLGAKFIKAANKLNCKVVYEEIHNTKTTKDTAKLKLLPSIAKIERVDTLKNKNQFDTILKDGEKTEIQSNFIDQKYTVFVSVPKNYTSSKKYPVVFLVDGNIYFDIMAQTFLHYAEANVMAEAILVGIGYKDYATTNTLRSRDFTYPKADPKENIPMETGGAKEFLSFITTQVVPYIHKKYSIDTTKQILMGHSLGGYFTLFALNSNLAANNPVFTNYIAASPTAFYENNYIITAFQNANYQNNNQTQVYITFGGLEDAEFQKIIPIKRDDVLLQLEQALKEQNTLNYSAEILSGLEHTDTPLPTFVKGLKMILKNEK